MIFLFLAAKKSLTVDKVETQESSLCSPVIQEVMELSYFWGVNLTIYCVLKTPYFSLRCWKLGYLS